MLIAFQLSTPSCASWDGKWSGEGQKYVLTATTRIKQGFKKIVEKGYYSYSFGDGRVVGITVTEVTSKQAVKLRRESDGFCGYDWMVNSILKYGEIRT